MILNKSHIEILHTFFFSQGNWAVRCPGIQVVIASWEARTDGALVITVLEAVIS